MTEDMTAVAPEDLARAELYGFLAALLSAPPSDAFLAKLRALSPDAGTAPGRAIARISEAAAETDAAAWEREFTRLFIGLGRGELLPYASYYTTGQLNDRPLANLRRDMKPLGIGRAQNVSEPEDNIASILEMMAGLITGVYGRTFTLEAQRGFFQAHLGPWAGRFFDDLEEAEEAHLYVGVGQLGAAFMGIEKDAFDLM
ncbi:TorD/DmsD family molecular chaperone [Palleronia abyssalis]|uniref:Tat proofreading chaperone DmsD n=1 Tax=Palleronia abyssalis TaxID=1501240 RepID=A0A2R8BYE6_9RHOB|nr:molecular chaperone TorD family protein [Palleronia abyssalis]SPJ25149.1 Tat proofreading chaperone DmsD [Palleronia abyssalis]